MQVSELTGIGFLPPGVTGFFLTWNEFSNQPEEAAGEKGGPEKREEPATRHFGGRGKPSSRVNSFLVL